LRAGDRSLVIVGCHADRFALRKSLAGRNYLTPPPSEPEFPRALRRIIDAERIDLLIPNSEADVGTMSELRDRLPGHTFLPRKEVIELCQDKYALTMFLKRRGLPVPLTYPVTGVRDIQKLFRRLRRHSQLWCRIRRGSGSIGAIPVKTPGQARGWIRYWEEMREVSKGSFTLSEYLPGRDFCVQSLWKDGRLVLAKMHERLSYHIAGSSASGVSSTAALAKTILIPRIARICAKAVRAVDPKASGVFFVDLKENDRGTPCITEINAGRFANVSTIHDLAGKYNMAATYVRLAIGGRVGWREKYEPAGDCYVMRDLDALPLIFRARDLYTRVKDVRE
jgi:glutathione synthase/RimK-type ligase-like ATP-grasp enzyme